MNSIIDLRSDTVTLPTHSMLESMIRAPLGYDVYREDPTVRDLEAFTAALLGKEAGLFMPTGTMANLCAILTHCPRGSRVVVGDESHVYRYEAGGASVLGGLVLHPLHNTDHGSFDLDELSVALESPDDPHVAPAGLLTLENTHNRAGGMVLDAAEMARLVAPARASGVPVHLDGARLFNAAVALGVEARTLVAQVDSVQVCFSKGLSAPVGSMLVGPDAFIARARRIRKMLGGGMRQAGVLAAACRVSLAGIDRLAIDHRRASKLATELARGLGPIADTFVIPPASNMMVVQSRRAGVIDRLVKALREVGVLTTAIDARRLRAVVHAGIDDDAITRAAEAFPRALSSALAA